MSKTIDETGNRYGRLTVIKRSGSNSEGKALWECVCDCGNKKITTGRLLRIGMTQSCGCLNKEMTSKAKRKYIVRDIRLYYIWSDMIQRCENDKTKCFPNYGGRGINVCQSWHDADAFFKWAIENGYKDNLTIDRIDYNGNYEPSNCRWATMKEQLNNRRNNRWVTIDGETKTLQQWCDLYHISRSAVDYRLSQGLTPKVALTKPVVQRKRNA